LRQRGDDDQANEAESELPDSVHHQQHADLLAKYGIKPRDLIGKIGL
jgi:hypothetical protein